MATIFFIIVGILSAISSLMRILDWWQPKTERGKARSRRLLNHLIARMREVEGRAVTRYGCAVGGVEDHSVVEELNDSQPDEDTELPRGAGSVEDNFDPLGFRPRGFILDRLARGAIRWVAAPWFLKKCPQNPMTAEEIEEWFFKEYQESQS